MSLTLTVGDDGTGRKLAVISRGGHPALKRPGNCEVLAVEIVTGWGQRKITDWFRKQEKEAPWETRQ